ncbi:PTS fructose transporter subunit IIC [Desmospora activa]|uniref:PTS system D-fructose-specific IIB component (F1P-forming) (Frc family) /PTS system D-fructose-specific IIC component (F1P-forming) (Frc family) n=1 Tax=Desmospora activa DSM 45169 TaxID=1121389 RepID=A0A2T4ZCC4_9BACL|nr:PTS fructose transporter subunit IIBC [Desmospora activa]PTM59526.1 PTS system D-fructose-specific IIB component (F1P-forming) (Frc family) /PTS system D-fructose-specific IIC component (F1P-forming) (Frc family) [Desmospora activa DSM 45169]
MKKVKIVAATGCPTGIAHTFMAEEALKKAAAKLNVDIKVETHGQIGVENELSPADIQEADGVIIAADKNVNADRFYGKPTIEVSVTRGIREAEQLIQTILDGKAKPYQGSKPSPSQQEETTPENRKWRHAIYKHLMNGVSHMLPFVVGGGVLIAVSFLFGIHSADPEHESYHPLAAFLNQTGSIGFQLMVPILAAFIAESMAKRPGMVVGFIGGMIASTGGAGFLGGIVAGFAAGGLVLLLQRLFRSLPQSLDGLKAIFLYPVLGILLIGGVMTLLVEPMTAINEGMKSFLSNFQGANPILLGIIIGSMCAFDMGGPVNKAAYVTGTALLGEGNFYFMAGVSAACITPPLVIAFATVFFPKRFDKEERNAGLVNFILGSTHITEGAIPFAAKNPMVVLPILMVASSVSAVLTYLAQVQVPAPHGGFLVLPVVTGALVWVLSILAGSLIGAVLYGWSRAGKKTPVNQADDSNGAAA